MSKKSNRLNDWMTQLRKSGQKAFCAFLTAGFPDLKTTAKLAVEFEKAGVDVLELGYPFSDPLADGPTIQYSSQEALDRGISVPAVLKMMTGLRAKGLAIPAVFFTYFNPVLAYGPLRFARDARRAGFDAVLIPDLPPEEEPEFQAALQREGLLHVFLVAPTTSKERSLKIAKASQGFIYYVSLRGVTGARKALPADIASHLKFLRARSKKPILIGFGVSTPAQAKELAAISDGIIVGSAIVERIRAARGQTGPVAAYVRQMVQAVRSASIKS